MDRRKVFLQNKSFIFYHLTFENDFEFENGYGLILKILQRNQIFRNCLINSNYIPRIVISYLNNISMKTEHTNYPRFIPLRFRLDVNDCLPIMLIITT